MNSPPENGLVTGNDKLTRCWWHGGHDDYLAYHDAEWGRPVRDENRLFEKICLEGFQAGLSWLTILRKREAFRESFAGFDFHQVARFRSSRVEKLLQDTAIVRHRGKIESTINNAKRAIEITAEFGSLADYFWQFEPAPESRPRALTFPELKEMNQSEASIRLSKDLKRRGWSFVGPTTVYAFMQAMGMVNDHLSGCYCRDIVEQERATFARPGPGV